MSWRAIKKPFTFEILLPILSRVKYTFLFSTALIFWWEKLLCGPLSWVKRVNEPTFQILNQNFSNKCNLFKCWNGKETKTWQTPNFPHNVKNYNHFFFRFNAFTSGTMEFSLNNINFGIYRVKLKHDEKSYLHQFISHASITLPSLYLTTSLMILINASFWASTSI